ncbi:hypothetical protein OAJ57_03125 [Alphaproteobacteria bacterium]|nr:hypothetical protein [Alphaproteobacteria bacterium]
MTPKHEDIRGNAILFSEMTPPDGKEDDFNDWYDGHHSPSHVQGVPGFISAMRYQSGVGPHYLAVYELESPEILKHEEYKKRKLTPDNPTYEMLQSVSGFTRYIGVEAFRKECENPSITPLDAPVILCVFFSVPMESRGNFEDWYDTEHIPMLLECSDWLMARRFDIVQWDPEPYTHVVLHYLNNESALESDALKRSRDTDWRQSLADQPWFTPQFVIYHRRNSRFLKSG